MLRSAEHTKRHSINQGLFTSINDNVSLETMSLISNKNFWKRNSQNQE